MENLMMQHNVVEDEELFFPIDVGEYPRKAIVKSGMTAIYAVSTKEYTPTKIGVTGDLGARLGSMQFANWNELYLYYAVWFPGKELASLIESAVHFKLQSLNLNGEWFNVTPTIAKKTILEESSILCGGVKLVDHKEMVGQLRTEIKKSERRLTFSKNQGMWDKLSKSDKSGRGPKWRFPPFD